jgi:hypothetical protein
MDLELIGVQAKLQRHPLRRPLASANYHSGAAVYFLTRPDDHVPPARRARPPRPAHRPPAGPSPPQGQGKGKRVGGKENHAGPARHGGGAAASRAPVPRAQVTIPLEPGTLVECRRRDGSSHAARVVDRRALVDGVLVAAEGGKLPKGGEWEHYVHYRGLNRRMDEWVALENLNLNTVVPPEPIDLSDPK